MDVELDCGVGDASDFGCCYLGVVVRDSLNVLKPLGIWDATVRFALGGLLDHVPNSLEVLPSVDDKSVAQIMVGLRNERKVK